MVKMRAGEKKKLLILNTCKELFYNKGYEETTFIDVSRAADVPQGSITYHFDNKLNIGLLIRHEFETKDYWFLHEVLEDCQTSFQVKTVIGLLHYWHLLYENEHIRRFLIEVTAGGFADVAKIEETKRYYLPIMEECGIADLDEKTFDLISATHVGMELAMLGFLARDLTTYTAEEIALFFIQKRFELIGVPREQYEKAIERGRRAYPLIPFDDRFYKDFLFEDKYVLSSKKKLAKNLEEVRRLLAD